MKLTTDNGRLLIEPDGNDSPVVNDMHVLQGWVLVMADAAVVEIEEAGDKIHTRKHTALDLSDLKDGKCPSCCPVIISGIGVRLVRANLSGQTA